MARCSALACGRDTPREGQVSGPVSTKAPGDPAGKPIGVIQILNKQSGDFDQRSTLEATAKAKKLIEAMASDWEPQKYENSYHQAVQALVARSYALNALLVALAVALVL